MAAIFGTSVATDTWLMASVLPNLLFGAVNSTLSNVVVPVMAGHPGPATRDEQVFVQEMMGIVGLAAITLTGLGEVFTPGLIRALAPGFGPTALTETVALTRIMLPTIVLWSGGGLVTGVLQAKAIYAPTAGVPILMNCVRIVTIATLGVVDGINGVAWGFLLAVGSQWVYLFPMLRRQGFPIRPLVRIRHPWTRQALRLTPPLLVMTSTGTVGLIVDRILASGLETGTIAALNYSFLIVQLPLAVFVNALALPGFTRLAEEWNADQLPRFRQALRRGLDVTTLLVVPALAFLLVDRGPVIALLYQRGAFTPRSTQITARLLGFWALGLPAWAWGAFWGRAAMALKKTVPLMGISVLTVATNVTADLLLVRVLGGAGLALGTVMAGWVSAGLTRRYVLRRTGLGRTSPLTLSRRWVRAAGGVLALSVAAWIVSFLGWTHITPDTGVLFGHIVLTGFLMGGLWIAGLILLRRRASPSPHSIP